VFSLGISSAGDSLDERRVKMKQIKIEVLDDRKNKDIMVSVSGVTFSTDNFFDTNTIHFFLDEKSADSLSFHLGTILQDREREREEQNHKYREAPTAEDIARAEAE